MSKINPKAGEYWMTERGGLVRLQDDLIGQWPLFFFDGITHCWWSREGLPLPESLTSGEYGPLTHRCNPDGTPWKAQKDVSCIRKPVDAAAKWKHLAKRMSQARTIADARKIYNSADSARGK